MSDASRKALIDHLRNHAVRTDGPFTLRSGEISSWYIDARQTTFDGAGAALVGAAVADRIPPGVTAVGGMTMGADPIAVAAAIHAGAPMKSFSIRKEAKDHGTGGRLVGPVGTDDRVLVLDDTITTGGAMLEAIEALQDAGVSVVAAMALVDRSGGIVAERLAAAGIDYTALVTPIDLGVEA